MPIGYPRHASRGFDCIPYWRRKVRAMPNQEKDWHCFFYLGPADGIDGGIAVYTLVTRRLRQDRTWRLLQDILQFLMRYDDHSKLFNGEDPKFSALVSDDQSPTGDQMGNDAIEIYMHFAVRPDPDYHASHTGDASVYLTAPGQEIDLELVSEGVDPVRLNPPPDGESSTRRFPSSPLHHLQRVKNLWLGCAVIILMLGSTQAQPYSRLHSLSQLTCTEAGNSIGETCVLL